MRSNVIKQTSRPGDKNPVPFEDWVTAHADRIPGQVVTMDEEEHEKPGFSYREVINRNQARVASKHVAVNMLPTASLDVGRRSEASQQSDQPECDAPPFGLTEDEFAKLREEWEEEHRQRFEEERAKVQEEAYNEGYETAAAEADEEIQKLHTILTDGLEQIESRWRTHLEEIEPHLGQLALKIAERILDAPLPEKIHEGVAAAIHDAIDEVAGDTRTDVTVHPADYMRLKETGLLEQLNSAYESLQWHSDPELEQRGNWIVETPKAAIRHIKGELLADVEQTLELP